MRTLEFGLRGRICALAVALVAALCCCVLCVGGVQQAWADGASDANGESAAADVLGAPAHSKTLAQGDDGNWYLTLDVTGKSQSVSGKTKANVVVVLDTSGSMLESDVKSFEYKSASPDSRGTKYGKVGDEYVLLWETDGSYYYRTSGWNWAEYDASNGLYVRTETTSTRIAVAKSAVEELAGSLLGLNTEENPDAVQMALVTFNRKANVVKASGSNDWFTDLASFKTALGSVGAQRNTGTNWEDALCTANGIQGDSDPTYVVFVSDGNPTYYKDGGTGSDKNANNVKKCYEAARDDAYGIVHATPGKEFYSIGAFGNVNRMQGLVNYAYNGSDDAAAPAGHYFAATDHEGLESAFSSIVADITKDYSYTNVKITDVMSEYVDVVVPEGATQLDFIYKKDGVIWTASEGAPSAEYRSDDATVIWDLSSLGTLEDGVTYSVTFPVKLNQNAYNTVAGLTNDGSLYSEESCPRIKKNDDGSYSVCTNSSATLDYVSQRIVGGGDPEEVGEGPATYESPVMPVPVSRLTIVKSWGSTPAGFDKDSKSVAVVVKQSDVETAYATKTLGASNNWTGTVYVPAGEARTYTVSEIWEGSNSAWSTTYKVDGASVDSASVNFDESPTALSHTVTVTNAYSASGSLGGDSAVKIEATKTLTGRDLKAEEFSFAVKNVEDGGTVVARGSNDVNGNIAFGKILYTTESVLADVENKKASVVEGSYVYQYTVAEDTADLAGKGVTAMVSSFTITVALTDDGEGKLTPSVTYPKGVTSLEFKNQYGSSDGVSLVLAGSKSLSFAEELNPPSIAGKYTFTLNGLHADSMTANNDAAGNVSFSAITYTMDDLKEVEADEDGVRTEEFTYTVSESGEVEGVANDEQSSKTVTVTLTDDGEGNLTAVANPSSFTFTNTYSVEPTESSLTGDGKVSIEKVLTGRDLVAGEFEFQLKSADGAVVAKGANDASGSVLMSSVKFEKPGTYVYTLSEVEGDAARVSYDPAEYVVTAKVSDNGDGTMSVAWTVAGEDDTPLEKVVFKNAYEPEVVPPATPVVPEPDDDGDDDADASDEPASSDDGKQVLAKTGDSSPALLLTAIAGAAALVLVALVAMRRRSRR